MLDHRFRDAIHAANASIHGAARAARQVNHPNADRLKRMAQELDDMVDALPSEQMAG